MSQVELMGHLGGGRLLGQMAPPSSFSVRFWPGQIGKSGQISAKPGGHFEYSPGGEHNRWVKNGGQVGEIRLFRLSAQKIVSILCPTRGSTEECANYSCEHMSASECDRAHTAQHCERLPTSTRESASEA